MSVEPQPAPERAPDGWRWTLWVFGAIFLLAALHIVVLKLEVTPADAWPRSTGWDHLQSERVTMVLGLVGAIGLVTYAALRRRFDFSTRHRRLALKLVLGTLVVAMGVNYFSARRSGKKVYLHSWDTYHYVLGAKYFEELDYFYLYDCTAEALGPALIPDATKVRKLSDYWWTTAEEARAEHGAECRQRFSDERWAEFRQDLQLYVDLVGASYVRDMLTDHGYNGTPFHTFVAGRLAHLFPLGFQALTLAILLDIAAVLLALVFVCRVFGWRFGLLFAVHFFTLAVDRYAVTGCSFVRYWWLASLILGVCALQARRWATAGALLTVASAFVVFPVLFVVGAGLGLLGAAWRKRTLTSALKRFVLGTAVAGALCGAAGAAHGHGIDNYTLFAEDMQVHVKGQAHPTVGYLVRSPGYGVGLKFIFHYRGQHSRSWEGPSELAFARQMNQIDPYITLIGIALTTFAAVIALRLSAAEAASLFGVTGFFSLLGTTGYYFACANLLLVTLYRRRFSADGPLLIALFMGISALALYIFDATKVTALMYRTFISTTWLLFLLLLMGRLAALTGLWEWIGRRFRGSADAERASWPERGPTREP